MALVEISPSAGTRQGAVRAPLTRGEKLRLAAMAGVVFALLASGALLLALSSPQHYRVSKTEVFGVGTGLLALTLGIRHAFDADHIAAIDNTTRKLMAEGKRPLSVGFYFSLGHSSVVFVLTMLLGLGVKSLGAGVADSGSSLHRVTNLVGSSVSGLFLYVIAAINVVILASIVRAFRELRSGRYDEAEVERRLEQRGLMNRLFFPLARRVDAPWKMYPIGVLFGLGFDTATEIGLLVLSGSAVASGLPFWAILSLPLLFAGGMSLFDTLDGCFMNFAYHWAFSNPVRKIYYNLIVTGLSVAVAFGIGTIELMALLGSELQLHGPPFSFVAGFDLNRAGFALVALFVVTWALAVAFWHLGKVEHRYSRSLSEASSER
jgi:high-affinity nickel-transport protein